MWYQGPIAKLLVQVLVSICRAGERLLAGNCAKGHAKVRHLGSETVLSPQ